MGWGGVQVRRVTVPCPFSVRFVFSVFEGIKTYA